MGRVPALRREVLGPVLKVPGCTGSEGGELESAGDLSAVPVEVCHGNGDTGGVVACALDCALYVMPNAVVSNLRYLNTPAHHVGLRWRNSLALFTGEGHGAQ